MSSLPNSINILIDKLAGFPGIGKKSAQRMAFYILKSNREDVISMAKALIDVKDRITNCSQCHNITENDPCPICCDPKRDQTTICVIQDIIDLISIEKTGNYRGLYHVLGGVLSPLNGIGPDDLFIEDLLQRLDGVNEIILAINPTRDGETTTIYLSRLLKNKKLKVSRIAQGLPIGIDLEFVDENTIIQSIEGRTGIL